MTADNAIAKKIMACMSSPTDLSSYVFNTGDIHVYILYLSSITNGNILHKLIIAPLLKSVDYNQFAQSITAYGAYPVLENDDLPGKLIAGNVLIIRDSEVFVLSARKELFTEPGETLTENTILGPQKSMSHDNSTNLAIIRSQYPKSQLHVKEYTLGTSSKTHTLLLYDSVLVKQEILTAFTKKIEAIDADMVQSVSQVEKLINEKHYSLFPISMVTERPDRIVLSLSQGKIVLILQGTPYALVAPAVFFDFMSAMDDLYSPFWISRFLVILRYIALFLTITLPALYISIVSYNPEILRVQLTLSIAGSRAAVPYPSYLEVLIMLFMIEALTEASLRLPKSIGPTATTVGGLILGQAAQQAGLVSSIMIIITSAVAISNFVIPINAMSFAIRVVKYVIIVMAILFGIVGTVVGAYLFISYLASLRSFGEPYLRYYFGEKHAGQKNVKGDSA